MEGTRRRPSMHLYQDSTSLPHHYLLNNPVSLIMTPLSPSHWEMGLPWTRTLLTPAAAFPLPKHRSFLIKHHNICPSKLSFEYSCYHKQTSVCPMISYCVEIKSINLLFLMMLTYKNITGCTCNNSTTLHVKLQHVSMNEATHIISRTILLQQHCNAQQQQTAITKLYSHVD